MHSDLSKKNLPLQRNNDSLTGLKDQSLPTRPQHQITCSNENLEELQKQCINDCAELCCNLAELGYQAIALRSITIEKATFAQTRGLIQDAIHRHNLKEAKELIFRPWAKALQRFDPEALVSFTGSTENPRAPVDRRSDLDLVVISKKLQDPDQLVAWMRKLNSIACEFAEPLPPRIRHIAESIFVKLKARSNELKKANLGVLTVKSSQGTKTVFVDLSQEQPMAMRMKRPVVMVCRYGDMLGQVEQVKGNKALEFTNEDDIIPVHFLFYPTYPAYLQIEQKLAASFAEGVDSIVVPEFPKKAINEQTMHDLSQLVRLQGLSFDMMIPDDDERQMLSEAVTKWENEQKNLTDNAISYRWGVERALAEFVLHARIMPLASRIDKFSEQLCKGIKRNSTKEYSFAFTELDPMNRYNLVEAYQEIDINPESGRLSQNLLPEMPLGERENRVMYPAKQVLRCIWGLPSKKIDKDNAINCERYFEDDIPHADPLIAELQKSCYSGSRQIPQVDPGNISKPLFEVAPELGGFTARETHHRSTKKTEMAARCVDLSLCPVDDTLSAQLYQKIEITERALLDALKSEQSWIRRRAALVSSQLEIQGMDLVNSLEQSLSDIDSGVRCAAANALVQAGSLSQAAEPALLAMLKSDAEVDRWWALRATADLPECKDETLRAISSYIENADLAIAKRAIKTVACFYLHNESTVAPLIGRLLGDQPILREAARDSLVKIGGAAVPFLIKELLHPGYENRDRVSHLEEVLTAMPDKAIPTIIRCLPEPNQEISNNFVMTMHPALIRLLRFHNTDIVVRELHAAFQERQNVNRNAICVALLEFDHDQDRLYELFTTAAEEESNSQLIRFALSALGKRGVADDDGRMRLLKVLKLNHSLQRDTNADRASVNKRCELIQTLKEDYLNFTSVTIEASWQRYHQLCQKDRDHMAKNNAKMVLLNDLLIPSYLYHLCVSDALYHTAPELGIGEEIDWSDKNEARWEKSALHQAAEHLTDYWTWRSQGIEILPFLLELFYETKHYHQQIRDFVESIDPDLVADMLSRYGPEEK